MYQITYSSLPFKQYTNYLIKNTFKPKRVFLKLMFASMSLINLLCVSFFGGDI